MKITNTSGPFRATQLKKTKKAGKVQAATAAYGSGAARAVTDTVEVLGIPPEEMTPHVQQAIMGLMAEVDNLRKELQQTKAKISALEELADSDSLLPILNRRAFVRELNRMISFAERYGTPSSLVFFDLNDMKQINDQFGHEAGDRALQHTAHILLANIRGTDVVARLGGDEFGVLLAQSDEKTGIEKAENLATAIRATPFEVIEGQGFNLNLAHGVYTFHGSDNPSDALARADEAMYENKKEIKGEENVR